MSDEEYSSEEERRQGRGRRQTSRRPQNMSFSSEEEEEDVVGAPSSLVHYNSNEKEDGEVHSTEEVAAKDIARPQLSKETVKTAMKRPRGLTRSPRT